MRNYVYVPLPHQMNPFCAIVPGRVVTTPVGPIVVPRKGRKKIWQVRPASQSDRDKGRELVMTWGRNDTVKRRVIGDYEQLCRMSNLDPNSPASVEAMLGQMENSGLGPGTQETYVRYVSKRYPRAAYDTAYAAGVRYADFENKHAPDVSDEDLCAYVDGARAEDVQAEAILYLLKECGFRTKACRFFRRFRVYLPPLDEWMSEDSTMEVTVTIDKNRRRRQHRTTLRMECALWEIPPPSLRVWNFFMNESLDRNERIFSDFTATKVNKILARIAKRAGLPKATSYTFRRGYINRMIPRLKGKRELTKYTLHFKEETVEAFYRTRRC